MGVVSEVAGQAQGRGLDDLHLQYILGGLQVLTSTLAFHVAFVICIPRPQGVAGRSDSGSLRLHSPGAVTSPTTSPSAPSTSATSSFKRKHSRLSVASATETVMNPSEPFPLRS